MSRKADVTAGDGWHIGEDKTHRFTIYAEDSLEADILADTATREDISSWTLSYVVRRDPDSLTDTFDKTTADDVSITDGPAGECEVAVDDTDWVGPTGVAVPGVYYYELRRTDVAALLAYGDLVLQI